VADELPQWLVVAYEFGVAGEVADGLAPLSHLQPVVRPGPDTLVFITLLVRGGNGRHGRDVREDCHRAGAAPICDGAVRS
jgi:hypothetical protein